MARANIRNPKAGLRVQHCRATYRTDKDGGYEPFSVIKCGTFRVIDSDVQVKFGAANSVAGPGGNGFWILVFDTEVIDPTQLENDAVPYLPPKFCLLGKNISWSLFTEWMPFEKNLLVVPSVGEIYNQNANGIIQNQDTISAYIRYSTKEMTFGLAGTHLDNK